MIALALALLSFLALALPADAALSAQGGAAPLPLRSCSRRVVVKEVAQVLCTTMDLWLAVDRASMIKRR